MTELHKKEVPEKCGADRMIVGRFGRPHGLKGYISVVSFTHPRENILHYTPWQVCINSHWQHLTLLDTIVNNKCILTQIEGYAEREHAGLLTNIDIAICSSLLPQLKPDEYYWYQLIDMQVINQAGITLGKVKEIIPTGANDVLVVIGEKRHLIPYLHKRYIVHIDNKQRLINVDWDSDFSE